ncbi:unnamed protein product, partial [Staurois parvus]
MAWETAGTAGMGPPHCHDPTHLQMVMAWDPKLRLGLHLRSRAGAANPRPGSWKWSAAGPKSRPRLQPRPPA